MAESEIVISGISGRFPQCQNVEEFGEALLSGMDCVKEDSARFTAGVNGTPKRMGLIPIIDKFDAAYFGVHPKLATFMDPRQRILLETVYEAIIDAGYNPSELRGSRTGVYVGMTGFTNLEVLRNKDTDGYSNIGLNSAIAANRISYCFDFKGPSYSLDTACSSSITAFVNAIDDINDGVVDSAIVCGTHLIFHPHETLEFVRLNMLSPDGKCKVFSEDRDGYVRSETIASCFIQKKNKSRRIYLEVLGAAANCDGFKKEGITFPSNEVQFNLMQGIYSKINVDPRDVVYMEAHGTGTPIGDIQECLGIEKLFCRNRKAPLLVGSAKSNMGHSEMASGFPALAKLIIASETGIIPANLHVEKLDRTLPGICDNTMKVITENLKWNGGLVCMNSFGFGGANAHVALKTHSKEKLNNYQQPKNRLVLVSGRTEEAVLHFLEEVKNNQDDQEFLALVDEIHKINVDGHNYRGYITLGQQPQREVAKVTNNRPIWFVYTGMGSQWSQMGCDMMKNDVFRNTINRCAEALKPYNIDLIDIITNKDPKVFDNITNCFCAIGCMEIALTDVLYSLGIYPDGIAGHSLGESGCSYADGNITPEQAALLVYARGYGCEKSKKIAPGQMAAIGLSKEEVRKILPENVYIACQNSKDSTTVSGDQAATRAFVERLSSEGVFARLVKSADIPFHTKYIEDAGKHLLEFCKNVLTDPKPRSSKWVSSSVPPSSQDEKWAKYNCAEYHYNNFCNPVLFDQVYEHIPENAIVIEVAPHGLLQAILKREMSSNTVQISLLNRASDDNEKFFLSAIGKIFMAGSQPNLKTLYNEVSFPVARGTKMLAPLVKWDHSVSWYTPLFEFKDSVGTNVTINLSNEKHSYLEGHEVDGRILMPATGYIELVWQLAAVLQQTEMDEFPVVIENVKFHRATILSYSDNITFLVNIMKLSGNFEIFESGSVVCTGTIRSPKDVSKEFVLNDIAQSSNNGYALMKKEDFYKECWLRKYNYKDYFQGIREIDVNGVDGVVEWKGKYTSFLDTMVQMTILSETSRDLLLPTSILKVVIDPIEHMKLINEKNALPTSHTSELNVIKSGGIEIIGVKFSRAPRKQHVQQPYLEISEFVNFESTVKNQYDLDTAMRIALQIILQNCTGLAKTIKICEVTTSEIDEKLNETLKTISDKEPLVEAAYVSQNSNQINTKFETIVLNEKVLNNVDIPNILENLTDNGFILYKGNYNKIENKSLQIIFQALFDEDGIYLLRPQFEFPKNYEVVNIRNSDFNWLEKLKNLIKADESKVVYLFSQDEDTTGIVGLVKSLLTEPYKLQFRSILIEKAVDIFSTDDEFYREQIKKNLTFNIWKENNWGTFVYLPMKENGKKDVGNAAVTIKTPGDLSTLSWIERPFEGIRCFDDGDQVYVYYSALNFKDVVVATGKLSLGGIPEIPTFPEVSLCMEYSGVTAKGKRVMGVVGCEAMSLQINSDPLFTWEVPKDWSLKDAATVPCVYATCYYGMIIRGKLQPGESILIQAGTGGIGIAAINIALSMGCKVFTTVGSQEKRDYLKKMFPKLEDKNIGNSRDASFETMVKMNTKGRGVDMVLNSLADNLFQAAIRCVAVRGRYIEIGKVDLTNSAPIPSHIFLKNISFHGVHLEAFFYPQCEVKIEIQKMVADGIARGVVKPLPNTVFEENQVEAAVRYLATGKHKGKVLVEIRKEDLIPLTSPIRSISAEQSIYFDPRKSYIIVGGLGGVGLELTEWLIRRGATKVVLNSRRGVSNGYQSYCLRKWSQYKGVIVKIDTSDTTTLKGAEALLNFSNQLGPVGGIFNLAVILKDALMINQTKEKFEDVFKTKIVSGQNLDIASRILCDSLEHFVVFSSLASGRGNMGQTNYAMANSALERLCEKRKKENLPGLAVQFGPIGEVGVLVNSGLADKEFKNLQLQNVSSCIEALEQFMLQPCPVGCSSVLAVHQNESTSQTTRTPSEAVAHILGINNLDLVDKTVTLSQLGLDSLMTTEIKQTLYRNFQLELTPEEIRDLTFESLINTVSSDTEKKSSVTPELQSVTRDTINSLIEEEVVVEMNNISNSRRNIFLLHPIEGHVTILKPIAKKLKASAYGLQSTKEYQSDNMNDLAKYYIKQIKKIQPKGPYSIVGYSYGAALTLEMCLLLEQEGEKVDLICVDGSPVFVQSILKSAHMRFDSSEEKSRKAILESFSSAFSSVDQTEVQKVLRNSADWKEQVENISELISKTIGADKSRVAVSAESFYNRVHASYFYNPSSLFKGRILLIRRVENPFFLSENYEMQKNCEQPIGVVKLEGDHTTILLGDNAQKVADIINRFLDL